MPNGPEYGVIQFLEMEHDKEKLAHALEVIRTFKNLESMMEWLGVPFSAWAKLEQLEEFLEHLVEGKELKEDSQEVLAMFRQVKDTIQPDKE